jgi:DNA-binding PadR family transcriptional regulator
MLTRDQIPVAVELLVHGFRCEQDGELARSPFYDGALVDPTRSEILRQAGTASVTVVLEELVRRGLVGGDVAPVLGAGGPAIGYRLSEKGRDLRGDRHLIEEHFRPRLQVPAGTLDSGAEAAINQLGDEAQRALEAECPLSVIVICGRVIESLVLATALREGVLDGRQPMGFSAILNRLGGRGFRFKEPILQAMALVATYRNETAHAQAITIDDARATLDTKFPTLDEAQGVLLLTKGALERLVRVGE